MRSRQPARVAGRHVVERAVRLDVAQAHAFGRRNRRQRAELIQHQVSGLGRRHRDLAASKAGQVGEPGVRTAGDAVLHRQTQRPRA